MNQLVRANVAQAVSSQARAKVVRELAREYGPDAVIEVLVEVIAEWQTAHEQRFDTFRISSQETDDGHR